MTSSLLSGIKILDFTSLLPGPYATMILADLGATVIRLSRMDKDLVETIPPLRGDSSAIFDYLNRNKYIVRVDLKDPDTISTIKSLLPKFDVIIEQFRPGVMKRLGLDFDTVKKINPQIIYCSLTAYGQTGPLAHKAGHDINFQALSGISSVNTGEEGPLLLGTPLGDLTGAFYSVISILGAIIKRSTLTTAQFIDVSMMEATSTIAPLQAIQWLSGKILQDKNGIVTGGSYYDYYKTKDNRFLAVGALEPKFMKALLAALDIPEKNSSNPLYDEQIKRLIADRVSEHPLDYWISVFDKIDACVEPVLEFDEFETHPHIVARGLIVSINDETGHTIKQIGHPVKYSAGNPCYNLPREITLENITEIIA